MWRGALADIETAALPMAGVYVLGYMGRVLYVGRSTNVPERLRQHLWPPATRPLLVDHWLQAVGWADAYNVRLDVLECPADEGWLPVAEEACIRRFRPLFNVALNA
jgi:hypothetical protein